MPYVQGAQGKEPFLGIAQHLAGNVVQVGFQQDNTCLTQGSRCIESGIFGPLAQPNSHHVGKKLRVFAA